MEKSQSSYPDTIDGLHEILVKLRSPGGCPWDREQTTHTLANCLSEECAELLEAIDLECDADICEELGDVLMNSVFQAVLAEERGAFTLHDVLAAINEKMIRRHAHVFGTEEANMAEEALKVWEKMKAKEGKAGRESVLDGIPKTLSALSYASKMQRKAAKVGFDWTSESQIVDKIREELLEYEQAKAHCDEESADAELGDLLFAVVNLIRFRKADSETLLRRTNRKFEARFRYIEQELLKQNLKLESVCIEQLESLWQSSKAVVG